MQETVTLDELEKTAKTGSSDTEKGVLGNFALKNAREIQSWQDRFCEMAGVYAMCLNEEGTAISRFSGNPADIEIIRKYNTINKLSNYLHEQCIQINDEKPI